MLSSDECVTNGIKAGMCKGRCLGLRGQMLWVLASEMELTLEIGEGHVDIAHGHFGIGVPE